MLTVEVSYTGTVLLGPPVLGVPCQQVHQVIGGAEAALAFNRLGQADGREQD